MTKMKALKISALSFFAFLLFNSLLNTGCGLYRFNDVSIPDSIKTIKVNFVENRARYVFPQLSPTLTDRLKQKINNQTRLTQTNSENAHYEVSATITDYSVSTSGIADRQAQTNRLTVGVAVKVANHLGNKTDEYNVSRSFEFPASSSLESVQNSLMDEMVRNLSDDIFNRIFSNW